MSSIDNRVVQLTFDNEQFESAVQTTIKSLSNLESSLDFGSSASNFSELTAAANNVDLTSIQSSLESLQSRFSTFGTVCTAVIVNLTNTILDTLGSAISSVTTALSSVVSTSISGGITRVLNLEQAYFSLEGLLDTEEEVEAVMENVNDAVSGTAYSLDAAANVASSLVASGLEPGDELLSSLQAIAGVAAQTGSEYADIGSIFTTVAGNGKLMTEQLRQFSYRGLNAAAVLAEALDTTEANIYEMVSDGEIDFQTFSDAMYDAFGTHAKDANKTFSGVCSNISSALSRVGALFVDEILANEGPLVDFLNALRERINDVNTNLQEFADIWETWAISILDNGTEILTNLDLTGLFEVFYEFVDIMIEYFGPIVDKIVNKVYDLVESISDISVDGASDALENITQVLDIFFEIADNLIGVIKPIASGISDILDAIIDGFSSVFDLNIESVGDILINITQSMEDFVGSIGLTDEGLESLTTLSEGFFKVLQLGGEVVAGFADILVDVASSDVWKNLTSFLLDIASIVGTAMSEFVDSIHDAGVVDTLSGALTGILSVFDSVLESITEWFGGFSGLLKSCIEGASSIGGGLLEALSTIFGGVTEIIGSALSWVSKHLSLGDIIDGIFGVISISTLKDFAQIITDIKYMFDTFKSGGFQAMFGGDGIQKVLSNLSSSLVQLTKSIRISSIVAIAGSVFVLALAMGTIAEIDSDKLAASMASLISIVYILIEIMQVSSVVSKGLGTESFLSMALGILLMAYAIEHLSDSVLALSAMNLGELVTGLIGVGGLVVAVKSLMKSMSKISTKDISSVDVFIELAAVVIAMKIMVSALEDLSQMSLSEITTGVIAMTALLVELEAALAVLGKMGKSEKLDFSNITNNVLGMIGIAAAVMLASDTLISLSQMSWEEIAKGLTGLAGVLVAMISALATVSTIFTNYSKVLKVTEEGSKSTTKSSTNLMKNIKALIGLAVVIILMGYALENIGSLSWEQIGKGLSGCAGALAELLIVLAILSGIKSKGVTTQILAMVGIAIVLRILAADLEAFADISWEGIAKGLVTSGVALTELAFVLAFLSGIKNSGTVLVNSIALGVIALSLLPVAEALAQFGAMTWGEIARGLVAMAGAFTELMAVMIVLGILGPYSLAALVGSVATASIVASLEPLAEALAKFGEMSWDEIARGLVAMEGALLVLASSSITGVIGIIGAWTISTVADNLLTLAEAVQAFADMGEDASTGVALMGEALQTLTLVADAFSLLGSLAIAEVAEPLGTLAESIAEWKDITVPDDLGDSLNIIADGISAFFWQGWSASAVAEVATPLGDLATSIKLWTDVSVPSTLGEDLSAIAEGISAFGVSDVIGALVTSSVAGPLGDLAESVMAWSDVTLIDGINIKTNLKALAAGIGAFGDLSGILGALTIDVLGDQLSTLATSVQSWEGVTLPEGMKDSLTDLAEGVKAFGADSILDLFTGSSLSDISAVLPDLATGVQAWVSIELPYSMSNKLQSLAEGVAAFGTIPYSTIKITKLQDLGTALIYIYTPLTDAADLDYDGIVNGLSSITDALQDISAGNAEEFAAGISNLANSIGSNADIFVTGGVTLGEALVRGISSGASSNIDTVMSALSIISESMANKSSQFEVVGEKCIVAFGASIYANRSEAVSKTQDAVTSVATQVRNKYSAFYNAGAYLTQGLAAGIKSKKYQVVSAAQVVAKAALTAAQEALDESSPSKATQKMGIYFDEGLSLGIESASGEVENVATAIGLGTLSSLSSALSGASSVMADSMSFDTSGMSDYAKAMSSSITASGSVQSATATMQQALLEDNLKMFEANNQLATELSELRNDMGSYTSALSNMETTMYVDGRKLASTIAKPMNQSLSTLSKRGRLS